MDQPSSEIVAFSLPGIEITDDFFLIKKFQIDTKKVSPPEAITFFMNFYKNNIVDITIEEPALDSIIAHWYTDTGKIN